MPGLRKSVLYGLFEGAIRESGWSALVLPPTGTFPARYRLIQEPSCVTARVYIWTITHGGGAARAAKEYRIQLLDGSKALARFEPELGGKTLILGWWPEAGVFAGYDHAHHTGPLGKSPSIQVGEDALRRAAEDGMAVHIRGNKEIVIAFRPEFLGTYVAQMEDLHRIGLSPRDVVLLQRIASDPAAVPDGEIEAEPDFPRRQVMASVRRAVRAYRFGARVIAAYKHRCAFCGVQLRLLDAAHILPVAHPDSVDRTANGVAVCTLHHRAYDNALLTFDDSYLVHVNERQVEMMVQQGLAGGIEGFRSALQDRILLPDAAADRPAAANIRQANKHRGWILDAARKSPIRL